MNPRFPIFIPSKGRWESSLTSKYLTRVGVPHTIIVEEQELAKYRAARPKSVRLLVLDPKYQREYDTCDDIGMEKPVGSGAARNFAWDRSIAEGHSHHWIVDDNIHYMARVHDHHRFRFGDGSSFWMMEEFALQYENVSMSGPTYEMFVPRRERRTFPVTINSRIYSCNLVRNDVPFRWRGRYNEDTILSLDMLKAGWCTLLFKAIVAGKAGTQSMRGGNTDVLYRGPGRGTYAKTKMLYEQHPDMVEVTWRWGRCHHMIDYDRFRKSNKLRKREGLAPPRIPALRLAARDWRADR